MNATVKVNFRDIEVKEYPKGTTLYEVSKDFQQHYNYPILTAKLDNEICDLSKTLERKCTVDFYDRSSVVGNSVYGCSVQLLMLYAIHELYGPDVDVKIENSIDKGVYCETIGFELDKQTLKHIENKMLEIVKQDLRYVKVSVSRFDAMTYFKRKKKMDKVNVLKYISNTYINLYRLDDFYDYFFSEMAYSTKSVDDFKLTYLSHNGFVLSYPSIYTPEVTLDYCHRPMIADTFAEYTKWGNLLGISEASELNEIVSLGKYNDVIRLAETHYESQLARISDTISENSNIKIVLLGGPTSSGKSTTAKKLSVYLQSKGYKTHIISIDDYYLNQEDKISYENNELDFESLKSIDVDLFNRHLTKLLSGEKVLLPEFNFSLGKREYKKKTLQLQEKDIIIIEGLHTINEDLTLSVDRKNKFKIYINPFTQLNIDRHNRIHTSDTRRLRRIIRDNKFRDCNVADTLRMWKKIREGEEKYIFPYQNDVDVVINSALVYEIGVLKTYAEPLLFSVSENDEMYPEAIRLINFLRNFLPIPSDEVPKDSILREFIGGSGFNQK